MNSGHQTPQPDELAVPILKILERHYRTSYYVDPVTLAPVTDSFAKRPEGMTKEAVDALDALVALVKRAA